MVRAPCCEKIGLKKGPWSPEEDQILISFIHKNGHSNWRALPKQAGLLRCGKSCRLRWINYLSPEIKRGSFTKEEEDTIIQLHQMLGNRWSAIAAKLPGRTDNEIKNVWHTHLKKKLPNYEHPKTTKKHSKTLSKSSGSVGTPNYSESSIIRSPASAQSTSSDMSSVIDSLAMVETNTIMEDPTMVKVENVGPAEDFIKIDESFWTEIPSFYADEVQFESPVSGLAINCKEQSGDMKYCSSMEDDMDFWYNVFLKSGELSELAEF